MKPKAPKSLLVAAGLAALVSDAAGAAELHRGSCRMNLCNWYSVEAKDAVASNRQATLYKVTLKTWTSKHRGGAYDKKAPSAPGEVLSIYYQCSKTRPAVVESVDGKWSAAFLDLHNPPGFQEFAVMQYFVVCHGFDLEHPSTRYDVAARRFGYRKISDTPDAIALNKPEEILEH